MYSLFSLDVVALLFSSFVLCRYYFSSELFNISVLIFSLFPSAAVNQRPHDCMHSAGEDGGFERVLIGRLTNTTYTVSHRTARITFTTCHISPGWGGCRVYHCFLGSGRVSEVGK